MTQVHDRKKQLSNETELVMRCQREHDIYYNTEYVFRIGQG